MATVKKIKKAQTGADVPKGYVRGEMTGKLIKKSTQDKWEAGMADALDKQAGLGNYAKKAESRSKMTAAGIPMVEGRKSSAIKTKPKAKNGGKFPDLNKDGKVTKADILKGRGVIAKKGAKVAKKAMPCASCGKKMKK